MRIAFDTMLAEFERVLLARGFSAERAHLCARLFAETSLDGVHTHGLNRFPRFIEYIAKGYVDTVAQPALQLSLSALERWDGRLGPGNLNAHAMMGRACALAKEHGIGCVALGNTNHWMRGGTYGWQAASLGCAAICFTNTTPNLPPWGGDEPLLGNNPFVMALPRSDGHIVVDIAMSQFSYGKIEQLAARGELLPVDGGYDPEGRLTRDPAAILETKRTLPIGFWKGSALSVVLDLAASLLSGGATTLDIGERAAEYGVSQVFIAIDCSRFPDDPGSPARSIERTIEALHAARLVPEAEGAFYPGERTLLARKENLEKGIPVDEAIWNAVRAM
jgi:3-dehydro-L-gulonate 2-dehydrogenase